MWDLPCFRDDSTAPRTTVGRCSRPGRAGTGFLSLYGGARYLTPLAYNHDAVRLAPGEPYGHRLVENSYLE
ncbi:hypothetical protein Misp02_03830 [Microtetraspora sp. NBRC 16547]|nr:hypothetical protein Misp02_03830 [Microtetraspora sp. NBRC 16547]